MTNKTKAAIEEAAKLPTAEETLSAAYKEAGWMYQLSVASGSCDHVSIALAAIESHTAAHTAALRERVKELEGENKKLFDAINRIAEISVDMQIEELDKIKFEK